MEEDDTDTVFSFDSVNALHLNDGNRHGEEGIVTEAVDLALVWYDTCVW